MDEAYKNILYMVWCYGSIWLLFRLKHGMARVNRYQHTGRYKHFHELSPLHS